MLADTTSVIKFRIWWNNEMVYHAIAGNGQAVFIPRSTGEFVWTSLRECIAMQFIGFGDRYHREIYVGDILRYLNRLYVVQAVPGGFELHRYKLTKGKYIKSFQLSLSFFMKRKGNIEGLEVLGNIYEHPGLLRIHTAKLNESIANQFD